MLVDKPSGNVADGWADEELEALSRKGLRRFLEPLDAAQGPVIRLGDETLINFSSNDYLSLAADVRVKEAFIAASDRYGVGSGASRLIVGDTRAHEALEQRIASFMACERALLFNSGYAANVGLLSTLLGREDVVFSDELNHASIVDGCRLSKAKVVIYPHADMDALEQLVRENPGRRRLIATDAVFSMDGDWAPIARIAELGREHGAAVLVDEAHALGVLGPRGSGLCAETRVPVDIRMGTLGKSIGCFGAFAATSDRVAEWLLNRARSLVFSTSLPAALCLAAEAAIEAVEQDDASRARLWRNIRRLADGLRKLGIPAEARGPIFGPRRTVGTEYPSRCIAACTRSAVSARTLPGA
ncbi:MAG: aminotransferase class I/II-fold pyridoxal phosphate-dependent enzyme, partial [Myxococcaceae bacterium]